MADTEDLTISPALQAEIRAAAAQTGQPARDIVRNAVERYLLELHTPPHAPPDPQTRAATVARMLKQRSERRLPEGVTIEDVLAWGREGRA